MSILLIPMQLDNSNLLLANFYDKKQQKQKFSSEPYNAIWGTHLLQSSSLS